MALFHQVWVERPWASRRRPGCARPMVYPENGNYTGAVVQTLTPELMERDWEKLTRNYKRGTLIDAKEMYQP